MIYVFDTSSLHKLSHFYPGTFPTLWKKIELLAGEGLIVSTREVKNELTDLYDGSFLSGWIKKHRDFFPTPTADELEFVSHILAIKHFQQLIGAKQQARGKPVADPFVIAAAQVKNGTVVTEEQLKPNAAKIPNVCQHFKIPCTNLEGFMAAKEWRF